MSIVTWPTTLGAPADFVLGQQRYDVTESSDSTGADAARLLGPPRWTISMRSVEALNLTQAGAWEAMLLSLRGRVNHLAMHDPVRAAPQGNLRGSPTLNATAAAGATSIVLANVRTGTNLLVYPNAFDNSAAWTLGNGATVTPNTNGRSDTITDANAGGSSYVRQTITVPDDSATYTGSIYIHKTSGGTSATVLFQLVLTGGSGVTRAVRINTDTGAILSGTANIVNASAALWRVDAAVTNNSTGNTTARFEVFPAINTYNLAGTDVAATGSAQLRDAQFERASAVSTFEDATLKAGDWLQLGSGVGTSQLVKVMADATVAAAGTMTVTIEPPLRAAIASASAVTWDRPVAYYKQTSSPQSGYRARLSTGYALDLLESWTA